MAASSNTSRREALQAARKAFSFAGAALLVAALPKKAEASSPESAGITVVFMDWVNEHYTKHVRKWETFSDNLSRKMDRVERLTNIRHTIYDQQRRIKGVVDGFYRFGKDPFGATLPRINASLFPLLALLDDAVSFYGEWAKARYPKEEDARSPVNARARQKAAADISRINTIEIREQVKALKAQAAQPEVAQEHESAAEVVGRISKPLELEILLNISEKLDLMLDMAGDFHSEFVSKTPTKHKPFGKKELEDLKRRASQGDGILERS